MKIAIAGYGVEGESSYRYYDTPGNQVVIVDEHQPGRSLPIDASSIIGEDAFSRLDGYDMVVRTPGLAPRRIKTDGRVWSATNEFFARCQAPIIGVTGSKGKGTTSSLITSMLRAAGHTVHLLGNIGAPALDALAQIVPTDIVVYELSSFQLWDLQHSPQTAVVLIIEPDHLDVHTDFEEYIGAKANIARFQSPQDTVIYCSDNPHSRAIAECSAAQPVGYQSEVSAHVRDGSFWYGEQELCSVDSLGLPGVHNQDNACAAIDAVWPWTQSGEVISSGLLAFEGLPHRLKFVRSHDGLRYFDDSIATTPGSTAAAIRAFSEPKVMIMGGSSKGATFDELATVAAQSNVRHVVAIGPEAVKIQAALSAQGVASTNLGSAYDMAQVVAAATTHAQAGDVVILSPACASFDRFTSYNDRGDQFIAEVAKL